MSEIYSAGALLTGSAGAGVVVAVVEKRSEKIISAGLAGAAPGAPAGAAGAEKSGFQPAPPPAAICFVEDICDRVVACCLALQESHRQGQTRVEQLNIVERQILVNERAIE